MAEGSDLVLVIPPTEIDGTTVHQLTGDIETAYLTGARHVVVDFAFVRFCDSSGLRALINAARLAQTLGQDFRIDNATGQLRVLAEVVGVSEQLGLDPSPELRAHPRPLPRCGAARRGRR